jgi:glycosyltransferase involved in cell wall biosynthesis
MKLLFLCLYPQNKAPSQRFRFEQFFPYFGEAGIAFDVDSFYSEEAYHILYQKGSSLKKASLILAAYFRRLFRLAQFQDYDYIFIQRAAAPIGPALIEFILARILKKKIIYDFDDAIWMPQDGKGGRLFRWLKSYGKVGQICRLAYHVTVGNAFLATYAKRFTPHVTIVPTVVDTKRKYVSTKHTKVAGRIVVGWTGSHSTIRYLLFLKDVLVALDKNREVELQIIADKKPEGLQNLSMLRFVRWNEEHEIEDLQELDIGLMPLIDNDWTRGKCGFKAIQYMALGIPALVSPVGVNSEIVDHNVNGFVCATPEEWKEKLELLVHNPELRVQIGHAARIKIEQYYSVDFAFPLLLAIVQAPLPSSSTNSTSH